MEELYDDSIIILKADLSAKKDNVLKLKSTDEELIDTINEYYQENLLPNNIEIFENHDNILITELGYFCAIYKKELLKIVDEIIDKQN